MIYKFDSLFEEATATEKSLFSMLSQEIKTEFSPDKMTGVRNDITSVFIGAIKKQRSIFK